MTKQNTILTVAEFKALVLKAGWSHEVEIEMNEVKDGMCYGGARLTSSLSGIDFEYVEGFTYEEDDTGTVESEPCVSDCCWLSGATVVDENGDNLDAHDLYDFMPDDFVYIDYQKDLA